MKIKSFIHSYTEIKKISKTLDIKDWRAPPAFKSNSNYTIDTTPEYNQD